jgi:microcystin-dependent protein
MPLKNGRRSTDLQTILLGTIVPVGTVVPFAGSLTSSIPEGWILCNGIAISRSVYSDLFQKIGTSHGYGDQLTTFNLPDYRGRFLRGVANGSLNDPERAIRGAMALGGAVGDRVGSVQGDEFRSHTHEQAGRNQADFNNPTRGFFADGVTPTGAFTLNSGGSETRPKNAYVNYIIKL